MDLLAVRRNQPEVNKFTFAFIVENAYFLNPKTETTETCLWSPMPQFALQLLINEPD
jgi:hypothetical protein